MAQGVLMPKEGITVESCIMGEWKVNVGDQVNVGDVLFSYETDKAEFECTSTAAGTLLERFYEEGDEVPCLINVCAIGNPGEDVSALRGVGGSAAPAAAEAPAAAPAAAPAPAASANVAQGVIMPKEGITVESCIMGEWKVNVGDQVNVGDILFTYETDKAEFECASTAAGTLLARFYEEGDEVPCLINVCAVGQPGQDFECLKGIGGTPAAAAAPAAEAAAAPAAPAAAAVSGPVATAVIMPKEGITVESCLIGEWQKEVGDAVSVGDVLFTYETDKAEFECTSTAAGTLLAKFYENGDEVPCLINVCAVGKPGDDFECLRGISGNPVVAAAPAAAEEDTSDDGSPISPRARALAKKANVELRGAKGTGPNGRIIERDVRRLMEEGRLKKAAAVEAAPAPAPAAPAPAPVAAPAVPAPAAEADYVDVKFNAVRKATAKSMMKSLSTMAQLTQQYSFDATQLQAYRKMLKTMDGPMAKISLNDMVMFAVSRTILAHPDLNANMLEENVVRQFKVVNLGFACDTPRGLLVPVIKNAHKLSLLELSMKAKALAAEARDGKLSPDDMSGGTFTVTNIGSFGCEAFTPVINPPQTGILGVCNIQTKIKSVTDGKIETYPAMGLSLTLDHRVVDGAPAARFMQELCRNLENFLTLLAK